ncbi:MAG: HAMP domain-containing protein [Deltaproteobacteria bacterium]|nr:HAMP domain-containing protein [Deltaproteobacteria bacterium]
MRLGIRGELLLVSLVLISIVGGASAFYVEHDLREWIEARSSAELTRAALAMEIAVARAGADTDFGELAHHLGETTQTSVQILDPHGRVLGDSRVEAALAEPLLSAVEIAALDPANPRQFRREHGGSRVAAVAVGRPGGRAVSVSMPLDAAERLLGRLHLLIALSGVLGIAMAVFMSGIASHRTSSMLRNLVSRAQALSGGESRRRLSVVVNDELSGLAGSLNQMAETLESSVKTIAVERDRIEAVLDALSDAVIACDERRQVTLVNRAALSVLGLREPPLGRVTEETVQPVLAGLVDRARLGEPASTELELSGRRFLARATRQRSGVGTVLVLHDVSELRRLELIRRDFVANVSHELRTPVSIVRANAETLLDGALEDKKRGRAFVEAILRHADRLSLLIADLLDLSRIESGRYPIELKSVPIESALTRAIDLVSRPAAERSLKLTLEVPEPELAAQADPLALDQVVGNLLENAVKYTPAGGNIVVRARSTERGVRIEVIDDGSGIAPEHRDRIFERFYRVDPGRSRDVGGTGLGLSIVKHLTEAMGGAVGVEPNAPQGSIFWITLRAVARAEASARPRSASAEAGSPGPT